MCHIRFTIVCILLSSFVKAQIPQPTLHSLKGIGSVGGDGVSTNTSVVSVTPDGGFIITYDIGTTVAGNTYMDSMCSTTTGNRIIHAKYNADASVLEWTRCFPIDNVDSFPYFIRLMPNGDSLIFGYRTNLGLYITKYEGVGNVLWSRQHGSTGGYPHPMKDGGFIFFAHAYQSDSNFTTHYGSWMTRDLTLYKVDSLGRKQWSKVYGGSDEDVPVSIVDAEGGGWYLIASSASNDHDCIGNKGYYDAYIARVDSTGNMVWHRNIGGSESERLSGAISNGKNGLYIAGTTFSKDGDVKNHRSIGFKPNFWLMEVDSSGSLLWENCYGGGGGEGTSSLCRATDGTIWMTGTSDTAGGQVDTNYGRVDVYTVQTDSLGNLLNAIVLGSGGFPGGDYGQLVNSLPNGKVLVSGRYAGNNGAFFALPFRGGGIDIFHAVLGPSATGIDDVLNEPPLFKAYPNPAKNRLYIEPVNKDKYTIRILDNTGKKLFEEQTKGNMSIDISGWVAGVYYINYTNSKMERATQKIIIQ